MDRVGGSHAEDVAFVRVLGPIQVVTASGCAVDLPSVSQRRLLARLAVDAPRALRVDLLCDVLGVSPGALRTIVSRLRKGFGDTAVIASQGRYRLAVPVDAALFTASLSRLGTDEDRIGTLERALALWTGPPFEEFSAEDWAGPEATRLAELHASAIEDHAAELIGARRWPEAIAGLKAHVSVHPLRDRPWGLLVQALGGAGRQADALAAFREYRAYLAEWTGTEPSADVGRIQQRIAAGWDGTEETPPPSSRGNDWLPLQAELVRGPVVIGRAREVELLAAETALAAASGARTVIVEGEAGIGKTTVLGAFARAVRDEGSAAVLYGRCQDGPAVPLEPFRSLIGHVVEHAPADVLRAHTARCGGHLVRIAPRLASRVELAGPAELARTGVSDDATERHLLFEAVSDLLSAAGRDQSSRRGARRRAVGRADRGAVAPLPGPCAGQCAGAVGPARPRYRRAASSRTAGRPGRARTPSRAPYLPGRLRRRRAGRPDGFAPRGRRGCGDGGGVRPAARTERGEPALCHPAGTPLGRVRAAGRGRGRGRLRDGRGGRRGSREPAQPHLEPGQLARGRGAGGALGGRRARHAVRRGCGDRYGQDLRERRDGRPRRGRGRRAADRGRGTRRDAAVRARPGRPRRVRGPAAGPAQAAARAGGPGARQAGRPGRDAPGGAGRAAVRPGRDARTSPPLGDNSR